MSWICRLRTMVWNDINRLGRRPNVYDIWERICMCLGVVCRSCSCVSLLDYNKIFQVDCTYQFWSFPLYKVSINVEHLRYHILPENNNMKKSRISACGLIRWKRCTYIIFVCYIVISFSGFHYRLIDFSYVISYITQPN